VIFIDLLSVAFIALASQVIVISPQQQGEDKYITLLPSPMMGPSLADQLYEILLPVACADISVDCPLNKVSFSTVRPSKYLR